MDCPHPRCRCLCPRRYLRGLALGGGVLVLALVTTAASVPARYSAPPTYGEPVGCYISNGDNDILLANPPIDSRACIDGYLDVLTRVYRADRLYWRAAQIEQILACQARPEHFSYADWLRWMKQLYHRAGNGSYAVEAAHARGMTVWAVAALFDHGGPAAADVSKGYGPMPIEARWRVQHPEWVPIDRYGLRRQSGPLCLAYPEARQALIDGLVNCATAAPYDGLMLHTYVEAFHARFDTEFGFNEPIMAEYRRRYGVDPREAPFDADRLARLQGEYLTDFVRELRTALRRRGVQLGLFLNPIDPGLPQPWLADTAVLPTGRIQVDWQRYVREDLVDELAVYCGGNVYAALEQVLALTAGTRCAVASLHSAAYPPEQQGLATRGVRRIVSGDNQDLQYGYFEPQPAEALAGDDAIARLSVLQQMADGHTPFAVEQVTAALRDRHVWVRRCAALALGVRPVLTAASRLALEAALDDPENTVRCSAWKVLAQAPTPTSLTRLLSVLERPDEAANKMLEGVAVAGLAALPAEHTAALLAAAHHPQERVRAVVVQALARGSPRAGMLTALLPLRHDRQPKVRWAAAQALGQVADRDARHALGEMLADEHPTVRDMAALQLSSLLASNSRWLGLEQHQLLKRLAELFGRYGSTCKGRDAEWGWRCLGEALLRLGPRGDAALQAMLQQTADLQLAERAWQSLYVRQSGDRFIPITAEQAEVGYRQHPRRRADCRPPATLDEPERMPYLVQDMGAPEWATDAADVGEARSPAGRWRRASGPIAPLALDAGTVPPSRALNAAAAADGTPVSIEGRRWDYALQDGPVWLRLALCRQQPDSALLLSFTDGGTHASSLRVLVDGQGRVHCADAQGGWTPTPLACPPGQWVHLGLDIDLDQGRYDLWATPPAGRQLGARAVTLRRQPQYNALLLFPQGPPGTQVLVAGVEVTVPNPAAHLP